MVAQVANCLLVTWLRAPLPLGTIHIRISGPPEWEFGLRDKQSTPCKQSFCSPTKVSLTLLAKELTQVDPVYAQVIVCSVGTEIQCHRWDHLQVNRWSSVVATINNSAMNGLGDHFLWKKQLILQDDLTGKLHHNLSHLMFFTQIFVSCESVQYKQSTFVFLFNGSL